MPFPVVSHAPARIRSRAVKTRLRHSRLDRRNSGNKILAVKSSSLLTAVACFALALCGCGKSSSGEKEAHGDSQPQPTIAAGTNATEEALVEPPAYSPQGEPFQDRSVDNEASKQYDVACSAVKNGQGTAALDNALTLNEKLRRADPTLRNFFAIAGLDHDFNGVRREESFQAVIKAHRTNDAGEAFSQNIVIKDPGGIPDPAPPKASSKPPVGVDPRAPDAAQAVVEALAQMGAAMVLDAHKNDALYREMARLLQSGLTEQNVRAKLALQLADSIETRAAKVALLASLPDCLQKITKYKDSFFLGLERENGLIEVLEFKNGVTIRVDKKSVDTARQLNTGITHEYTVSFYSDSGSGLCRHFTGGWWGPWGEFPSLEEITIEKAGDWTIKRKPKEWLYGFQLYRYRKLTKSELDYALAQSESTRIIAKVLDDEKTMSRDKLPMEEVSQLYDYCVARGDYEDAGSLMLNVKWRSDVAQDVKDRADRLWQSFDKMQNAIRQ